MTVGSGLLANAVGQLQLQRITESVRRLAGPYRFSGEWIQLSPWITAGAGPDV
jgi:hypothetical protein